MRTGWGRAESGICDVCACAGSLSNAVSLPPSLGDQQQKKFEQQKMEVGVAVAHAKSLRNGEVDHSTTTTTNAKSFVEQPPDRLSVDHVKHNLQLAATGDGRRPLSLKHI